MTGNPIDSVISDIARKIDDYVDFPKFSSDKRHDDVKSHVAKWGSQFGNDMDFVLRHTRNVLSRRYFSLEDYNQKLTRIARNEANLHNFENDCLLDIQTRGGSQHQLVSALN
ncbi:TPA: hypothetical protein LAO13_004540, partial [Escherichia coli]|nr:hypothetical protein [Escherichia coli]